MHGYQRLSFEMPLGSVKDIYNQCYKTFVHWLNVPIDYLDQSDYHQNHPSLSHPQPINEAPVTPSSIHHVSSLVKTTSNNFDLIGQVFSPILVSASPFHVLKIFQPGENIFMLAVDEFQLCWGSSWVWYDVTLELALKQQLWFNNNNIALIWQFFIVVWPFYVSTGSSEVRYDVT